MNSHWKDCCDRAADTAGAAPHGGCRIREPGARGTARRGARCADGAIGASSSLSTDRRPIRWLPGRLTSPRRPSGSSSCSCTAARRRSIPSTTSRCSSATTASRCRSPSRGSSPARRATCSARPGSFASHGESGTWVSELFPHVATAVDDLCVINCDARVELAARRCAARAAHRQRHVRPAEHGLLDHLRPGNRESGPARLHHHLPVAHPRRRQQLELGLPARRSTRGPRSATPASLRTRPGSRSSRARSRRRASSSGWSSTCSAR